MPNYKSIAAHCKSNSKLSCKVVDDWLIHYAAEKDKLEKLFKQRLKPYSNSAAKLSESNLGMLISQFMAHCIFKEGGLIKKYLNQSQVKLLRPEEYGFLEYQAVNPWRFCFSVIVDEPAKDFYTMEDVFTAKRFLLYSPGTGVTMRERGQVLLWLNLIAFNGQCWQTFGPVVGYNSFDQDDIFFFATEVSTSTSDERTLLEHMEKDPLPYMMLITGAAFPMTFHKNEEIVYSLGVHQAVNLPMEGIEKAFEVEYAQGIYQLTQIGWGEFPYYNTAYYNEKENELLLQSMTDIGFRNLEKAFAKYGIEQYEYAQVRIHPAMLTTVGGILRTDIILNPYEAYFKEDSPEPDSEEIGKLNALMGLLIPAMNAGKTPDIAAAARKVGVDEDTAIELMKTLEKQFGKMKRR